MKTSVIEERTRGVSPPKDDPMSQGARAFSWRSAGSETTTQDENASQRPWWFVPLAVVLGFCVLLTALISLLYFRNEANGTLASQSRDAYLAAFEVTELGLLKDAHSTMGRTQYDFVTSIDFARVVVSVMSAPTLSKDDYYFLVRNGREEALCTQKRCYSTVDSFNSRNFLTDALAVVRAKASDEGG